LIAGEVVGSSWKSDHVDELRVGSAEVAGACQALRRAFRSFSIRLSTRIAFRDS
jgi:hypothetical protein